MKVFFILFLLFSSSFLFSEKNQESPRSHKFTLWEGSTNEKQEDKDQKDKEETKKPEENVSLVKELLRKYLSGLQAEYTSGVATVSSYISKKGKNVKVASGEASQEGWKFSENKPESKNWFFFHIIPNYFQQSISIKDFRKNLPEVEVENKETLETVVTDYESGKEQDPLDPNVFDIQMKSSGIELAVGYSQEVRIADELHYSFELLAGISLGEYRTTKIKLGAGTLTDNSFAYLQNWHAGFTFNYFMFDDYVALRLSYYYQSYLNFAFPKKMEFRNPTVSYNEEIRAYERERVYVDSFDLSHSTFRVSIFYIF